MGCRVGQAAASGGDIEPAEYRITCKNGEVRIVEISGIIVGRDFMAVLFDITERKRAEQERHQAQAEAMKSMEAAVLARQTAEQASNALRESEQRLRMAQEAPKSASGTGTSSMTCAIGRRNAPGFTAWSRAACAVTPTGWRWCIRTTSR
ncbi:hypothetical protein [Methylomonas koyamae]|uniref:hypothetical protein n=1 Tax=Methylomonas koyamae TaxID=702114 RepID=UPI0006CFC6F1|nr:hypothetical protein [Methylomonas koyamae]